MIKTKVPTGPSKQLGVRGTKVLQTSLSLSIFLKDFYFVVKSCVCPGVAQQEGGGTTRRSLPLLPRSLHLAGVTPPRHLPLWGPLLELWCDAVRSASPPSIRTSPSRPSQRLIGHGRRETAGGRGLAPAEAGTKTWTRTPMRWRRRGGRGWQESCSSC